MKKILFIISAIILVLHPAFAQNKYLSIGSKEYGIGLGKPKQYNGLKFSLWDKNIDRFNGIHIAANTKAGVSNGLKIGLVLCQDSISNGVSIGGVGSIATKTNGLTIGGLFAGAEHCNGLLIAPLLATDERMNGVALGIMGFCSGKINGFVFNAYGTSSIRDTLKINGMALGIFFGTVCDKLNGFSFGIIANGMDTLNGVSVAAFNKAKVLHGIQFGLWNVALNNKRLKRFPLVNMNFRRIKRTAISAVADTGRVLSP